MRMRVSARHSDLDWEILPGEIWCVLGRNGSGKTRLAEALAGDGKGDASGQFVVDGAPSRALCVSLEQLQRDYEDELKRDATDFSDRVDYGSTGLSILLQSGAGEDAARKLASALGVSGLLERGCRQFSSGETRRIYLLREVLRAPELLVLDESFEGLDAEGRRECSDLLVQLHKQGIQVLLLVNHLDDVPEWATHVALLDEGQLVQTGCREVVLHSEAFEALWCKPLRTREVPEPPPGERREIADPLVQLRAGQIVYDGVAQFADLNWEVRRGEHWLIEGENGCGKSSLLGLITGDHPQCYTNDLLLLGFKRGGGESIWEIKREIGFVSSALHRDYRVSATAQAVVVSGCFDSIGLYQAVASSQLRLGAEWLDYFSLGHLAQKSFRGLSFGEQRLVLVARALIKQPTLLILDEPTQGLDDNNRRFVLQSLRRLEALRRTTVLFVSHRDDEHLAFFEHRLQFEHEPGGAARYRVIERNARNESTSAEQVLRVPLEHP